MYNIADQTEEGQEGEVEGEGVKKGCYALCTCTSRSRPCMLREREREGGEGEKENQCNNTPL
jgi:hypothetical protein